MLVSLSPSPSQEISYVSLPEGIFQAMGPHGNLGASPWATVPFDGSWRSRRPSAPEKGEKNQ